MWRPFEDSHVVQHGRAFIAALLSQSSRPFEIQALTWNKDSRGAQRLAGQPSVRIVATLGHLKHFNEPRGFSSVTIPMNAMTEELQGKAMTQAAQDAGVEHIVFTATDRDGLKKRPRFHSCFPLYLRVQHREGQYGDDEEDRYDMDFLAAGWLHGEHHKQLLGRAMTFFRRQNGLDRGLQLIRSADIGKVAAKAVFHASADEYRDKLISLAGHNLSRRKAAQILREAIGLEMPATFGVASTAL